MKCLKTISNLDLLRAAATAICEKWVHYDNLKQILPDNKKVASREVQLWLQYQEICSRIVDFERLESALIKEDLRSAIDIAKSLGLKPKEFGAIVRDINAN